MHTHYAFPVRIQSCNHIKLLCIQEFDLATKKGDAVGQRAALDACKAKTGFPVELLESMAALVNPMECPADDINLRLAQEALKAALLLRLSKLSPESCAALAQVCTF